MSAAAAMRSASFRSLSAQRLEEKENKSNLTRWQYWKSYLPSTYKLLFVCVFYVLSVWYYHTRAGWSITKCVYFITVSITTVGYGDLYPETNEQRVFTMFMLFVGLVAVFSIINDFATYIIAAAENKALETFDDQTQQTQHFKQYMRIILSLFAIVFCLAIGTVFFVYNEKWDFITALYFSLVTTFSVGYGDRHLSEDSSRVFLIFYIAGSVVLVAGAIGNFGSVKIEIAFEKRKLAMLNKDLDLEALMSMDQTGNGVDQIEFLTAMLVQMNGLNKEKDIDPWIRRFHELDADKSGRLDKEDLKLFAKQQKRAKLLKLQRLQKAEKGSSFNIGNDDDEDDNNNANDGRSAPNSTGGSVVGTSNPNPSNSNTAAYTQYETKEDGITMPASVELGQVLSSTVDDTAYI